MGHAWYDCSSAPSASIVHRHSFLPISASFIAGSFCVCAAEPSPAKMLPGPKKESFAPGGKWKPGDMSRPRPRVITPPEMSGLTEVTKHAILSYPLPDQQSGEKFAAFTYLHSDA